MQVSLYNTSFYGGEEDIFEHHGKSLRNSSLAIHDGESSSTLVAQHHDVMTTGWFSMNRENGGPSYICSLPFSYAAAIFTSDTALICFVFITPIIAFIILLPSFRKKHLSSVLVVILCLLTGLGTTCAYVSSSWATGETEVKVPISPKGRPIKSLVGFWVGLWHAKITHITDNNHTTHYVTWVSRAELVGIHKTALKEGWPLPLVSLTAEISGEGLAWRGVLGDAVMHAGSMTSYILIAALYSWAVWVVILMMCPELSCWPLIITGTLTAISSLHYLGCAVYYFPEYVLVEGRMTKLRFGWAWWLMGCISVILAVVGVVLTIYDHMYPGKLGAMFILDFYTKSDALSGAPELLYAYDSVAEKHAHIYPLSVNNFLYDNKKMSNKNLLGKNCENRTLDNDTGNGNTFSDAYNANNNEIAGKETQDLIQYVNETENENEVQIGNENDAKTSCEVNGKNEAMMSPVTVINSSDHVTREAEHMATLRKRTPPEKSHSDNASKPQNDEYNYTTIHEGNTITRKFSVPILVPQASPGSNGRTFRKSFSKVHSKFKPNFSPRKPSKVNLISASKLDKSELNNDTS